MNKVIAICDGDHSYATHLAMHMLHENAVPYEPRIYRDAEELLQKQDPEEAVLLMIDAGAVDERVIRSGFKKHIVMVGGETEREIRDDAMSKFTPMPVAMQRVREALKGTDTSLPGRIRTAQKLMTIGVYSPGNQYCQTLVSLTLGQLLAREGRTLYINFESFSGLRAMPKLQFDSSLEDLLYFVSEHPEKISSKLTMTARNLGGAEIVPPIRNYESFQEIRGSEWLQLLDAVRKWTDYTYLVLDLSESLSGLADILTDCDLVYALQYARGALSEVKLQDFERAMKDKDCQDFLMRTRIWKLPVFRSITLENISELPYTELARYIGGQVRNDVNELRKKS